MYSFLKKYLLIIFLLIGVKIFAQPINVVSLNTSGRFNTCGTPPAVTASLSPTRPGSNVNAAGTLVCTNPCDSSFITLNFTGIRWDQNPGNNWIHGIALPTNAGIDVNSVTTSLPSPAWLRTFNTVTGAVCSGVSTGGAGFYYDNVNSNACCPGNPILDGNPANNYGDIARNCGGAFNISYTFRICNNAILNGSMLFRMRGYTDGATGCWNVPEVSANNIDVTISTQACGALFTPAPTASAVTKVCTPTPQYSTTFTGGCGNGETISWWTASTGGTQIGTGNNFPFTQAAPPCGTTIYASCCPGNGNACPSRRAFLIPGPCTPNFTIDNATVTQPTCAVSTGSVAVTATTGAVGAITYTLNPGGASNGTGSFGGLAPNTYTITGVDAAGCQATYAFAINAPTGCNTPTTAPISYCQNATAVPLTATLVGTGTNLTWYTALTGGTPLASAPTPSTATVGPTTYYVTQFNGAIESSPRTPLVVNVLALPTAPTVTSPVFYCQNATAVPLTATGTNLLWYTGAIGGTGSATAPTPITTALGSTNYYVSQTSGTTPACEGPRAQITVTINPIPAAPVVTTPVLYCQNATATALTATGTNLLWYTGATGGTGSPTAFTPPTTAPGSITYYVSQSSNTTPACESPRAGIVVTVTATPVAPTVSSPIFYCQNATATPLTATGTNLLWYSAASGGIGSTTAPTPLTTIPGPTTYYVSQTTTGALGCEGPRASIVVNITALPSAPTVTSPVTYCQNDVATQLTATGTNLLWYNTVLGGTGSAVAPTPITTAIGPTNFYVSQTDVMPPGCEGPRALITVNVIAPPAAPVVTSPVVYCQGASTVPLTALGINLLWYTVPTGGTSSTIAPTPSSASVGSITYYVSQTAGTCESPRAAITVTISATPAAPIVNTVLPTCFSNGVSSISNYVATQTYTFTPAGPTVGAGGAITGMTLGTAYTVITTLGTCPSAASASFSNGAQLITPPVPTVNTTLPTCTGNGTATISNYAAANTYNFTPAGPTVGALGVISNLTTGTSYTVTAQLATCTSAASTSFSIVAQLPVPAIPTITPTLATCFADGSSVIGNYVATQTYTFTPAGPTVGAGGVITGMVVGTSYTVITTLGTCPSAASASFSNGAQLITPPVPTVSTTLPTCTGNGTATISNYAAANTYNFTPAGPSVGGSGVISNLTPGTVYVVTAQSGPCTSVASTSFSIAAQLVVPAIPTITPTLATCFADGSSVIGNYVATQTYTFTPAGPTVGAGGVITGMTVSTSYTVITTLGTCPSAASTSFSNGAQLVTPPVPTVNTTLPTCTGNGTATISNYAAANTYNFTPAGPSVGGSGVISNLTPGTVYVVTAQSGPCTSVASTSFSIAAQLVVPAIPTITPTLATCFADGSSVIGNYVATQTYTFTPAGPTVGAGGVITGMTVSTSYTVITTLGTCPSAASTSFSNGAQLVTPPVPTVNTTLPTCTGNGTATITNYAAANTYTFNPTGPIVGAGGIISNLTTGTSYTVTAQLATCTSAASTSFSIVAILPTPAAPSVITPVLYCQNTATIALTANGTNLLWYTTATGGTGNTTAPTPSSVTAGNVTYYVSQTVGICEGPRAAITVEITATPTAPTVISPISYCPNDPAIPLRANGTNLLWYTTLTGGSGNSNAPTPSTTTPGSTTYYVSQTTNGLPGCEGPRAAIVVNINNNNLSVAIGNDTTICEGEKVKFTPVVNPTPTNITYDWRAQQVPNSTIDNRNIKDATVSPVDDAVYILKAQINGCATEDTVNVNVRWKPIIDAGVAAPICLFDSAVLQGTLSHFDLADPITFAWTPTDSLNPNFLTTLRTVAHPTKSTWYKLTATTTKTDYGCDFVVVDSVRLVVNQPIKAFAGKDTIAVKGVPHQLFGTGGASFSWTSPTPSVLFSNPFIQKPTVTLLNDANIYLTVTDNIGCEGRDSVFIKVYDGPTYYIPNAFSPNGDGLNDIFRAIPVGISNTVYFRVYNRLGQLVFETNQWLKGWDGTFKGKEQPNGTYVWTVSGTDRNFKKVEMKGSVILIR
jgi:gliding motility-associated-like protein